MKALFSLALVELYFEFVLIGWFSTAALLNTVVACGPQPLCFSRTCRGATPNPLALEVSAFLALVRTTVC